MDRFIIQGGRPLHGTVQVSGSKNAALPMMAASLVASGPLQLKQVPDLADVRTLAALLKSLGVESQRQADHIVLNCVDDRSCRADYELVRRMRASICVLGPLLAKRRKAIVSLPGGCNIGHRPIDLHLMGLRALGAEIQIENGYVIASASRLRGARIHLCGDQGSTVTGTCNVMTAACLASGTTVIESAACEPEVVDLGHLLQGMGARIEGLGTATLTIEGVEELSGATHTVIPDRIEAATLMIAAVITRGDVTIENLREDHLTAVSEVLVRMGVTLAWAGDRCRISTSGPLHPVKCEATPYPGFPTDVQAQLTALLALTPGESSVTDKVFPNRFMHVSELLRMGANIRRDSDSALITGVPALSGAHVMASDLRASAALVLAALAAQGETNIHRIYHLDRGYEQLELKLRSLGASVERCPDIVP
ncbi:MAG: UDP-N-acetylglucosamine 1-carboxyvinyltransferase [Planctomycetaceae bacterium]